MVPTNQLVSVHQLRVALLRTSPHVWRRILVRSSSTLRELHQTILCTFGWSADHPHRFLIRGRSFSGSGGDAATAATLSEFQFGPGERFLYDLRFQDGQTLIPVWRHQVRLEKIVTAEPTHSFPRCTGGRGCPPVDQVSNPVELAHLADLFTPRYIVHRLAELIDQNVADNRIVQELRYLRPWLDLRNFSSRETNRCLSRQMGARP
jgi:hypothetical protein